MKRIICSLVLVFSLLLCLPACTDTPAEIVDNTTYQMFNAFIAEVPSYVIELNVTSPKGSQVNEKYEVTVADNEKTVIYRIEKLNPITLDGNNISIPDEYVSVMEGTDCLTAENASKYALPVFHFSDETVENLTLDVSGFPYRFTADVVDAEAFMGAMINGTNIKVEGEYVAGAFYYVILSYTSINGNTVTVTYTYN